MFPALRCPANGASSTRVHNGNIAPTTSQFYRKNICNLVANPGPMPYNDAAVGQTASAGPAS